MGSSRPAEGFKLFNLKIKFVYKSNTATASSSHSYQPLIKGQMIMLPLHSQDTAAIKIFIGQALPTTLAVGDVFDKQAGGQIAEFKRFKSS
jgi:hypothetical protein